MNDNETANPESRMKFFAAPLQGFTDAPWRHFHNKLFGGVDAYFSPFVRVEKGQPRQRDMRDILSPLNDGVNVIPQIIVSDAEEFVTLVDSIAETGYRAIDLNLGCPFPPQVNRRRGAGLIISPDRLGEISKAMKRYPDMAFSAKMRLGVSAPDQWKNVAGIIREMPLQWLTVHPRYARQQYTGEIDLEAFSDIAQATGHRLIYNGDLNSRDDIDMIVRRFRDIAGIMAGRGLLGRPSLATEWRTGTEWTDGQRISAVRKLHDNILTYYESTLCGDSQILSKIKPFWEYLENEIGHKRFKTIKKANSMSRYLSAVAEIQ